MLLGECAMPRVCLLVALILWLPSSLSAGDQPARPGPTPKGFLLPNGWTVTPAGKHVTLTDLPLNIIPLADGKRALVATSGYNKHELSLVELDGPKVIDQQVVRQSWYGLALAPDEKRLWWSAGGADMLHTFDLRDGKLFRTSPADPDTSKMKKEELEKLKSRQKFKSGVCLDAKRQLLFSLDINASKITAFDLREEGVSTSAPCGSRPYDVVLGRSGLHLYVSDWASRVVLVLNPDDLRIVNKIPVGDHPNQIAVHPKDDR